MVRVFKHGKMELTNKKLQVFISSTYTDLREERQAALESVLKTENIPSGMDFSNTDGRDILDMIYKWIDDSDIFVLILGGRYGKVEENSQKSYTQLEYEYAISKGKVIIPLILSRKFLEDKLKVQGFDATETENQQKYDDFKKMVTGTGKHCSFCDNLYDIRYTLSNSITAAEKVHKFTGWYSGKDLESLQLQNMLLHSENDKLKNNPEKSDIVTTELKANHRTTEPINQTPKFAFNSNDIDIQLHTIKKMNSGFQLHFTVENNSSRKLMDYGKFSFRVTPQKYEEEINTIGYSMTPTNALTSQFIYPKERFVGYYEWHTKLKFDLIEIDYGVLINGQYRNVATWYPTDVKKLT